MAGRRDEAEAQARVALAAANEQANSGMNPGRFKAYVPRVYGWIGNMYGVFASRSQDAADWRSARDAWTRSAAEWRSVMSVLSAPQKQDADSHLERLERSLAMARP